MAVEMSLYLADAQNHDVAWIRERHGEAFLIVAVDALRPPSHSEGTVSGPPPRPGNTDLILPALRRDGEDALHRYLVHPVLRKSGEPGAVTVGRSSDNDICIPHKSISRLHATLTSVGQGRFRLQDAESRNGTYLGRRELDANSPQTVPPGQTIQFGNVAATFLTTSQLVEFVLSSYGE